ncbi:MAG: haloacid dehalogenase-like hydrolase [Polyangiaceae bacterium]
MSAAVPPEPPRYARLEAPAQASLLTAIVDRCKGRPGEPPPVVVFDLDGTLMDNRPRTIAILRELAERWATKAPEAAARLRAARAEELDYLLTDSLARLGITTTDLVAEAEVHWRSLFFADEHMKYDVEVPGAVAFAKACHAAGATCMYLTGRDLPLMGIGSFRSLRDLGFPIGVPGTELVLKPDASMPDEAFKRFEAPRIRRVGHVVAAFDNEPANCNIFAEEYPDCASVLLDTQHLPGAPKLVPAVKVVADFTTG